VKARETRDSSALRAGRDVRGYYTTVGDMFHSPRVGLKDNQVRVGIKAPKSVAVRRK
jgi:hypothetical protein